MKIPATNSILVCDDDEIFRMRLARAFRDRGMNVYEAGNIKEAVSISEKEKPSFAVIDLRMADESGLDLIALLKKNHLEMKIIMLTGYGSIATAVHALKLGADNYLTKPVDADSLMASFALPSEDKAQSRSDFTSTPKLAQVEWDHIQRVVNDCNGNITQASKTLGLHRRSLQRKLLKMPSKMK